MMKKEPYIDERGNSRSNSHWYSIYPKRHYLDASKTRSLLLVNKRIATDTWKVIDIDSSDITAIQMQTPSGNVIILNVYNDIKHSENLQTIHSFMRRQNQAQPLNSPPTHMIWLGDFNRHHPCWDKPRNTHLFTRSNLNDAQILLDLVAEYDLQMILPKHIPTLRAMNSGNLTQLDNVFASSSLVDAVVSCTSLPEDQPTKTDHFPIDTVLNLLPVKAEDVPKPNFRATDWAEFRKALEEKLQNLPTEENIPNNDEFYSRLHDLTHAIRDH